jgi:hypothetical protein
VASTHWPLSHWQAEISLKPQTPIMPLALHCACTAAGSVGLSLLTQAGMAPQQLPTFLIAQSELVLQLVTSAFASPATRGGMGEDIGGGARGGAGGAGGVAPARSPVAGGAGAGAAQATSEVTSIRIMRNLVRIGITVFLSNDFGK